MSSSKGVGIPVKLLHEAEGHVITVCILFTLLMLGGLPLAHRLSEAVVALCRRSSSLERCIEGSLLRPRTAGTYS